MRHFSVVRIIAGSAGNYSFDWEVKARLMRGYENYEVTGLNLHSANLPMSQRRRNSY